MTLLECPYLGGEVEFGAERERHVSERYPDLLPQFRDYIGQVLANLDEVRRSARSASARLFSRWFDTINGGKHAVVVVVSEDVPLARYWIVTSYLTSRLTGGLIEWAKS